MATVDLTTKFLPKVDEQFTAESKRSLVTNQDFTWDGAATVRVYKVSTGKMNDYTDVGEDMRLRGVVSNLDGAAVQKVPASRLPSKFGFMLCHPCATVAPLKLQDYRIHSDPPGISGSLVEGRVVYDAFVLQNKAKAIYYQATT